MTCETAREAVSARLDGEPLPGVVRERSLAIHLRHCAACRTFERRAGELHRRVRVRQADRVPDLSGEILDRVRDELPDPRP